MLYLVAKRKGGDLGTYAIKGRIMTIIMMKILTFFGIPHYRSQAAATGECSFSNARNRVWYRYRIQIRHPITQVCRNMLYLVAKRKGGDL